MNFVLNYLRLEDKKTRKHSSYRTNVSGAVITMADEKESIVQTKCREEEHIHLLRERTRQRAIKRQQKRLALEKEKRDKRMAALEKEIAAFYSLTSFIVYNVIKN